MNEIVERLAQAICADEKQEWKQLEISPHGREYLDSLRVRARRYIGTIFATKPPIKLMDAGIQKGAVLHTTAYELSEPLEGPVTTFSPHDLDPRIGTAWPDAAARGK